MGITVADKTKHEYWTEVGRGDIVHLSDAQTLELDPMGVDYKITSIRDLYEIDGKTKTRLVELEKADDENEILYLFIKLVVGTEPDVRVYYVPDAPNGNRKDLVDSDNVFMFQQPEDEEFEYTELEFSKSIPYNVEGKEISYDMKGMGPWHAECKEDPRTCDDQLVTTIVEYAGDPKETQNPELLLLETGAPDNEYGGHIEFFLGAAISNNDIDILMK